MKDNDTKLLTELYQKIESPYQSKLQNAADIVKKAHPDWKFHVEFLTPVNPKFIHIKIPGYGTDYKLSKPMSEIKDNELMLDIEKAYAYVKDVLKKHTIHWRP